MVEREAALELFRNSINSKHPFDLVIIDIDMPDMQENLAISEIRTIEKDLVGQPDRKAFIIGLSGRKNRQMVTDFMLQGCNDILSKNFPDKQLLEILVQFDLIGTLKNPEPTSAQVFNGQTLVDLINRKLKSGSLKLPPVPRVAMRIRQLVDSSAEIDQIVELLRQDLSISIKMISISNSVAYGGFTKTTDISQAVSRLGLDRTVEVVMSICCRGYFVTSHEVYKQRVEALWWHCLACAHTTEMIVRDRRLNVQEDLFSLGLLHDVGKLVLIQAASELHKPKKYQVDVNFDSLEAVMQEHHERFGILLLQKWGYSKAFSKLIQHHRINGENASMVARQVLHQADLLVAAAGFGDGNDDPEQVAVQLEAMGYTAEQQAALTEKITDRVNELRYLFG